MNLAHVPASDAKASGRKAHDGSSRLGTSAQRTGNSETVGRHFFEPHSRVSQFPNPKIDQNGDVPSSKRLHKYGK